MRIGNSADKSRAGRNVRWIETHCRVPAGNRKGDKVQLTLEQRTLIAEIYNTPDAPLPVPLTGELAAYVALMHVCGIEAPGNNPLPNITIDTFSILAAAGPSVLPVISRQGEAITCPALGTRYPRVA